MSEPLAIEFAPQGAAAYVAALLCANKLALTPRRAAQQKQQHYPRPRQSVHSAARHPSAKTAGPRLPPGDHRRRNSQIRRKDGLGQSRHFRTLDAARKTEFASLVAEVADPRRSAADIAADMAFGAVLRSYRFRKYITRKDETTGAQARWAARLIIHTQDPTPPQPHPPQGCRQRHLPGARSCQ